jgi:N-acetylglucosaminyldiphosphoundecaprenol N-acetyl-beta-D-mannosaminyltransferase
LVQRAIKRERTIAVYINIHTLNLAHKHFWFKKWLNDSNMAFCDGYGVMRGARLVGLELRNRNTPPDWIDDLVSACESQPLSLFFLGGREGIAEMAKAELLRRHGGVNITGTHHGYFDKTFGSEENRRVIESINLANPDILLLGFGMPLQEQWLQENLEALITPVLISVGALFDYLGGSTPRSPKWMSNHGFEWLWRLLHEPRRLWRRYLLGVPLFFWRILSQRLRQ